MARTLRAGFAVVDVREVDRLSRTCATRQVVAVWIPAAWVLRLAPPEEHHK